MLCSLWSSSLHWRGFSWWCELAREWAPVWYLQFPCTQLIRNYIWGFFHSSFPPYLLFLPVEILRSKSPLRFCIIISAYFPLRLGTDLISRDLMNPVPMWGSAATVQGVQWEVCPETLQTSSRKPRLGMKHFGIRWMCGIAPPSVKRRHLTLFIWINIFFKTIYTLREEIFSGLLEVQF